MRAQEFIVEAFDQPYAIDWEDSEYGDVDALATLNDGTHLSIMFNQESGHDGRRPSHWSVEFYRNNSQEVTGEGDAQKVFATVLAAIQQFIKRKNPGSISFSASKEPEADMAQPGANVNPESRAKLYNRLVQRYASSMGYGVKQQEGNGKVTYTLRQAKPGMAEGQDKAQAVRRIQKMLNDRFDANLDVDGVLGPLTQKTINRFMPSARPAPADDPSRTTAVQGRQTKHSDDEQLDELSFLGSQCTKDCSGHRAGYEWSKRKGLRQANSWSPSFNKGAGLAVAGK